MPKWIDRFRDENHLGTYRMNLDNPDHGIKYTPAAWRIKFFFAWYDLWIGIYVDHEKKVLYICPLPMCVFKCGWQ